MMNRQAARQITPDPEGSGYTVRTELLRLARQSIEHGLVHREPLPVDCGVLPRVLVEPAATFTTLRVDGQLRGCCGTLDAIRLEVSVLSPLESIPVSGEAELLQQLTPGIDGLVVVADGRRATFLPKVWEMLPEPQQFLAGLKGKCGLAEDYWSTRLEFQRYRTTSYVESVTATTRALPSRLP